MHTPEVMAIRDEIANGNKIFQVLIVDDSELDRHRLKSVCKKTNLSMHIWEAESLAGMRNLLDTVLFDIVFLDFNLGLDTGLDALKILQSHEDQVNAIPIMLTSMSGHQTAVSAMRHGCADYLIKDELSVGSLQTSVDTAIERRILYAVVSEARTAKHQLGLMMLRLRSVCGPKVRDGLSTLQGLLTHPEVRSLLEQTDGDLAQQLDQGCRDLTAFITDLDGAADGSHAIV